MATIAPSRRGRMALIRGQRFWFYSALVMALVNICAFSLQHAMGRSSFYGSPPVVHLHAVVFFGWVMLYLAQNTLAATGHLRWHRQLGWVAAGWMAVMVVLGSVVTVVSVRAGRAPFFFTPAYFLVLDPLSVFVFAGLSAAGIAMRRRTQWHRRLLFCGTTVIMGPAVGRLIPMPLLIPHAGWCVFAVIILFPIAGMIRDLRADGRVHPAWWWGLGAIAVTQVATDLIAYSPVGAAIVRAATAGSPLQGVAPFDYPPPPWLRRP